MVQVYIFVIGSPLSCQASSVTRLVLERKQCWARLLHGRAKGPSGIRIHNGILSSPCFFDASNKLQGENGLLINERDRL